MRGVVCSTHNGRMEPYPCFVVACLKRYWVGLPMRHGHGTRLRNRVPPKRWYEAGTGGQPAFRGDPSPPHTADARPASGQTCLGAKEGSPTQRG